MNTVVDSIEITAIGPASSFEPPTVIHPLSSPTQRTTTAGDPHDHHGGAIRGWRRFALRAGMLAAPALAGFALARATNRRGGLVAGGLTAVALGALRVEMARWFAPEPTYSHDATRGMLELRHCDARVEASTAVYERSFEAALDRGYGRLACYVCGSNTTGEMIARTVPILTAMRDGRYTVSFVMPPGRSLTDLPLPAHPSVRLREVPAHSVAALRFRGRFSRANVAKHERMLLRQLIDQGLAARGSVSFAAFDSPLTLPLLRRNEVWIELV